MVNLWQTMGNTSRPRHSDIKTTDKDQDTQTPGKSHLHKKNGHRCNIGGHFCFGPNGAASQITPFPTRVNVDRRMSIARVATWFQFRDRGIGCRKMNFVQVPLV